MAIAARALSPAYLTAYCQPTGSVGWTEISGIPPIRSSPSVSVTPSKSRGRTDTVTPIAWQRRTRSSSAWWEVAEKLTTTLVIR